VIKQFALINYFAIIIIFIVLIIIKPTVYFKSFGSAIFVSKFTVVIIIAIIVVVIIAIKIAIFNLLQPIEFFLVKFYFKFIKCYLNLN